MATLVDPDFRARLRALNEKYAAGIPALMHSIRMALEQCENKDGGDNAEHHVALQKRLHTVAGSAGTFGFGVLGQHCRLLEHRVRAVVDSGADARALWPAVAADIRQLLQWAELDPLHGPEPGPEPGSERDDAQQ
jgi:HPt (histidine-containing phosphotransfer) domain-containing protein